MKKKPTRDREEFTTFYELVCHFNFMIISESTYKSIVYTNTQLFLVSRSIETSILFLVLFWVSWVCVKMSFGHFLTVKNLVICPSDRNKMCACSRSAWWWLLLNFVIARPNSWSYSFDWLMCPMVILSRWLNFFFTSSPPQLSPDSWANYKKKTNCSNVTIPSNCFHILTNSVKNRWHLNYKSRKKGSPKKETTNNSQ